VISWNNHILLSSGIILNHRPSQKLCFIY